jgi:uncharacterized membrane protein YdjX (TVP38/TMEM64 family)
LRSTSPLAGWTLVCIGMLTLILVPFFLFEDTLTAFGTAIMRANMQKPILFIIVIALLASDIVLPVPSSLVSGLAGHLLGFAAGLGAVWSGMMLGSLLGYWIGAYGGETLVRKIVGDEELARARGYAKRCGV